MAGSRTVGVVIPVLALLVGVASSCGSTTDASAAHASTPSASSTTIIAPPAYTTTQESDYFRDLSQSDPSLSPYVTQHGEAAVDALLAFGAGFCTLLKDGEDPSTAFSDLQTQAASTESQTGFSGSQTTYETIATDALIALCPSEQSALTQAQQAQLEQIEHGSSG